MEGKRSSNLPPGFRFHPTDEELIIHYLKNQAMSRACPVSIIPEVDIYKFDPWHLPDMAEFGENEWYFFTPRDRKYPNGIRPNRATVSGYWKATGTDKAIYSGGKYVGIKKALVFYKGRPPKGCKTDWIMHEYRLTEAKHQPVKQHGSMRLDDWVLCRIYKKNSGATKLTSSSKENSTGGSTSTSSSHMDEASGLLLDNSDVSHMNSSNNHVGQGHHQQQDDKFSLKPFGSGDFDWAALAGFGSVNEFRVGGSNRTQSGQVNGNEASEVYVPVLPPMSLVDSHSSTGNKFVEEDVQSGVGARRASNFNSDLVVRSYTNSVDPFRIKYPTRHTGFEYGYRH